MRSFRPDLFVYLREKIDPIDCSTSSDGSLNTIESRNLGSPGHGALNVNGACQMIFGSTNISLSLSLVLASVSQPLALNVILVLTIRVRDR